MNFAVAFLAILSLSALAKYEIGDQPTLPAIPTHSFVNCDEATILPLRAEYRTPEMEEFVINEADCRTYNDTQLGTIPIEVLVWCEKLTGDNERFQQKIHQRVSGFKIAIEVCQSLATNSEYAEDSMVETLLACEITLASDEVAAKNLHSAAFNMARDNIRAGLKPCLAE